MQNHFANGMSKSASGIVLCAILWLCSCPVESQVLPPSPQTGIPDASGHHAGDEPGEAQKEMLARLQVKRNEARQQQIVKDTGKLLALATELKAEVDKTNKDVLSLDVIKKADAIEKLSRSIKEHMKD